MSSGWVSWGVLGGRCEGVLEVGVGSLGGRFGRVCGASLRFGWSFWRSDGRGPPALRKCLDTQVLRLSDSRNLRFSNPLTLRY